LPRRFNTTVWLVAAVVGLSVVQWLSRKPESLRTPGPSRGDIVLTDETLKDEISGWKKTAFTPAKSPEQLPEGQFWWTHAWRFTDTDLNALVAFDQADFKHWHDLTVCYEGIGWKVYDRHADSTLTDGQDWPYIVARLSHRDTEAVLVFSLFFDDGDPVDAAAYEQQRSMKLDFTDRFSSRFNDQQRRISSVANLRQCQVFATDTQKISEQQLQQIVDLHLETRSVFRTEWLKQWRLRND